METTMQRVARGAGRSGRPSTFLVLAVVVTLFVPSLAFASMVTVNYADDLVLTVDAQQGADTRWTYDYKFTPTSAYSISIITVGFGSSQPGKNLLDLKVLDLSDVHILSHGFKSPTPILTSSSVYWMLSDSVLTSTNPLWFSITYSGDTDDTLMAFQSISIIGSGGSIGKKVEYPYRSVPEPATLFLVGAGMVALGTLIRRRKR